MDSEGQLGGGYSFFLITGVRGTPTDEAGWTRKAAGHFGASLGLILGVRAYIFGSGDAPKTKTVMSKSRLSHFGMQACWPKPLLWSSVIAVSECLLFVLFCLTYYFATWIVVFFASLLLFSSSFILFCIVATIARLLQDCCKIVVCLFACIFTIWLVLLSASQSCQSFCLLTLKVIRESLITFTDSFFILFNG